MGQCKRVDGISQALADLLSLDGDPAMREDELGRRFADGP